MNLAAVLMPVLLPLSLALAPPLPSPEASALFDAERALTHDAAAFGTRDGFLRWFAPTAIVFHPGPTNARKAYAALAPTRARFARTPWKTVMSAGGDIGWSTGWWTFKADSTRKAFDVQGGYATVWRRQPDGAWKIAFDGGVPQPARARSEVALPPGTLSGGTRGAGTLGRRLALWKADTHYAEAVSTNGTAAALARFGADDLVVLRQDRPRILGPAAARDSLSGREPGATLTSLAQFIGSAGDLGYTYGTFVTHGAGGADSASYLHVWQRGRARTWDLALEFVQPFPKRAR